MVARRKSTDTGLVVMEKVAPTGTYTNPMNVNRYAFDGDTKSKYERAIVDTICYMGWMSLKDRDHNVSGANTAAIKRNTKEVVGTRKAADALLERGIIQLRGTWSNGISVCAGEGFVPCGGTEVSRTVRKLEMVRIQGNKQERATQEGACEDMRYAEGASCDLVCAADVVTLRTPIVPPPGHNAPAQPAIADNTNVITPTPIYTPAVGTFVHLLYTHEDGRTTERVVNVKSVLHLSDGYFRGYDVRYGKLRNYHLASIQWMREWDRQSVVDLSGRIIIPAYGKEVAA